MTSNDDKALWEWLPARRSRARVTAPIVAAANLGWSFDQTVAVYQRLANNGHIISDKSGWHRGLPLC